MNEIFLHIWLFVVIPLCILLPSDRVRIEVKYER
jgi:hypothetical protein